jgi:CheY-like chemotaxis protein
MLMPQSGNAGLSQVVLSRTFKLARIMVVDDEPANVDVLMRLLERHGFSRVEGTSDPREAENLYMRMRPDLILLDLHMPHMDGFAVMDRLNQLAEAS